MMSLPLKEMLSLCELGEAYAEQVEVEFGRLNTREVVLTSERNEHIRERHPQDYGLFETWRIRVIDSPDLVLKDGKKRRDDIRYS